MVTPRKSEENPEYPPPVVDLMASPHQLRFNSSPPMRQKSEYSYITAHFYDCGVLWNWMEHSLVSKPVIVKKQPPRFECGQCGTFVTFLHRHVAVSIEDSTNEPIYNDLCDNCYEHLLKNQRLQARIRSCESIKKFNNSLKECSYKGNCAIFSAHHEMLEKDPERLTTDFMIRLTCGDEAADRYKEKFKKPWER